MNQPDALKAGELISSAEKKLEYLQALLQSLHRFYDELDQIEETDICKHLAKQKEWMEKIERIDKEMARIIKCAPVLEASTDGRLQSLFDQHRLLYQELFELNQKTSQKAEGIAGQAKENIKKITRQKSILTRYGHDSHAAGILLDFKEGK